MQHEYSGQLLDRALLRLLPDVFCHPIWIHFVEAGAPFAPDQLQSLLAAADDLLSAGNLVEACQALFICAFQQIRAGDYGAASSNIQRILILAEQHGLLQVACWATWGAAAICVRRGWFQQTAEHLEHLQSLLGQQQEWVLSDVIDIIRRAVLSQTEAEIAAGQPQSSDAVLSSAFDQMMHWGAPRAVNALDVKGVNGYNGRIADIASLHGSAGFAEPSFWQKIKRFLKGELRLKWVEAHGVTPVPDVEVRRALITEMTLLGALDNTKEPLPKTTPTPLGPELESRPVQAVEPLARRTQEHRSSLAADEVHHKHSLAIYCFGPFRVYQNNELVTEWKSLKGYSILKYLVTHRHKPVAKDILMDVFWPDADPVAARRNLHQAIYALRQILNQAPPNLQQIQFEDDCYLLNPKLDVWIDLEEFERHVQAGRHLEATGRRVEAMTEYVVAESLYQGDFLEEDLYEDWPRSQREYLRSTYLDLAERLTAYYVKKGQFHATVTLCHKILERDHCHEESHRRLMQCYLALGQRHLAIRQYQTCVQLLKEELDLTPAEETRALYQHILSAA